MPRPRSLFFALALGLALVEALPVGRLQCLVEHGGELAGIVVHGRRRLVGHLFGRDVVAPAQLDLVDAHLARRRVDQALHVVVALGAAGAAIGADRRGVGEHHLGVHLHRGRGVDVDDVLHRVGRGRHRRIDVGAGIAGAAEPHGEEAAVLVERQLGHALVIAAVMVAQKAFRALVGPFHRPAQQLGAQQQRSVLGIDLALHAERAADIAGQHAHLVGRHVQHVARQAAAHAHHALAADVQRPALGLGIVGADRRARLHGIDDDAVGDDLQPRDVGGLGEGLLHRFGVAVVEVERQVAGDVVVDLRRAGLQPFGGRGDGGQLLDVELDGFGGVLGLHGRLGNDAGHRFTDEPHLALGERRPRRRLHRRAVALRDVHRAFQWAEARRIEVGMGVDRQHARHGACRRGVDAFQHPVRDAAAHHHGVGLAREVDVVGIAAAAAQESRILHARHGLADTEFHQGEFGVVVGVHLGYLRNQHTHTSPSCSSPPLGGEAG